MDQKLAEVETAGLSTVETITAAERERIADHATTRLDALWTVRGLS